MTSTEFVVDDDRAPVTLPISTAAVLPKGTAPVLPKGTPLKIPKHLAKPISKNKSKNRFKLDFVQKMFYFVTIPIIIVVIVYAVSNLLRKFSI